MKHGGIETMTNTALADLVPVAPPPVTAEQLDLIRRTIAKDATPDELKLYLYDCARQGVHPLDKLIHFTKRSGKYTPITSIDFMRTRAADTDEYAGSDDAIFESALLGQPPLWATVTVWRLVQGQRCAFTATARWSEYKPEQNDFMWKRMPHTMLAKCAEALALRKGFPRQLAGLYAKEELDQASPNGYVIEPLVAAPAAPTETRDGIPSSPNGVDSGALALPPGAVLITKVEGGFGKVKSFLHHSGQTISLHGNDGIAIYTDALLTQASEACQSRTPVRLELKTPTSGKPYVATITPVTPVQTDAELDAELVRQEQGRVAGEIF